MLNFLNNIPDIWAVPALILLRMFSIVIPPIQGWAIDALALVKLGWWQGLIVCETGVVIGTSIAFFISRSAKNRFLSAGSIIKINKVLARFPEIESFTGLFITRLLTNPLYDVISYAAGFTRIPFIKFIGASFLSNLLTMIPLFYFGESIINRGIAWILVATAVLIAIGIWWKRRSRLDVESGG